MSIKRSFPIGKQGGRYDNHRLCNLPETGMDILNDIRSIHDFTKRTVIIKQLFNISEVPLVSCEKKKNCEATTYSESMVAYTVKGKILSSLQNTSYVEFV